MLVLITVMELISTTLMNKVSSMRNYLKRLNWYGAVLVFFVCGAAAFSRDQDPSLLVSFYVWMIFGIPSSLLFLFVGREPKDK